MTIGAVSLTACFSSLSLEGKNSSNAVPPAPIPAPAPSVQLTAMPAESPSTPAVDFEICADLPEWERQPESAHLKQLQEMPRYGSAIDSEPLKSLLETFWGHQIFSFTTYGLSARTEPLYLSGVWTALDSTDACYSGNQPEQINAGELAEVWLINHRIVSLEWAEGHYRMVVEPSTRGLQLIQFSRRERDPALPLRVTTDAGNDIEAVSGDW